MKPVRDVQITLVDLLDRVLDKGLLINADLIISVAGVPLIGVKLNAAIASVETMLKYGVMTDWFQAKQLTSTGNDQKPKFVEGEKLVNRFYGSLRIDGSLYSTWRYAFFYVTNRRILLATKAPFEVLAEIYYEQIERILDQKPPNIDGLGYLSVNLKTGKSFQFRLSEMALLKTTIEAITNQKLSLSVPSVFEGGNLRGRKRNHSEKASS